MSHIQLPDTFIGTELIQITEQAIEQLAVGKTHRLSSGIRRLAGFKPDWHNPAMLTVYAYQKCSTCRDALKWLEDHGIAHTVKPIREVPPGSAELKSALGLLGGDIRKLFNTSGLDYRALGMKEKLPAMTEAEALEMLSKNGNLVKRPFAIGDGRALVGFKPEVWKKQLTPS